MSCWGWGAAAIQAASCSRYCRLLFSHFSSITHRPTPPLDRRAGGNETSAASAAPPPLGAVPTFTVDSLAHLQQRLAECNTALGWGAYGDRTLSLSSSTWWVLEPAACCLRMCNCGWAVRRAANDSEAAGG